MTTKKSPPQGERYSRLNQARKNLGLDLNQFYRRAGSQASPPISGERTLADATEAKRAMDRGADFYIHPYVHQLIDRVLGPKTSKSAQRRQERLDRRHERGLSRQSVPIEQATG